MKYLLSLLFIFLFSACQNIQSYPDSKSVQKTDKPTFQLIHPISLLSKLQFSKNDEVFMQKALENNYTHQPSNKLTSHGLLTVTPSITFQNKDGLYCREYETSLKQKVSQISINATTCRKSANKWIYQP